MQSMAATMVISVSDSSDERVDQVQTSLHINQEKWRKKSLQMFVSMKKVKLN
jgi:hypothetical protein